MLMLLIKKVKNLLFILKRNNWRYLLISILLTDYEKHVLYLALDTRIDFLYKLKVTDRTKDSYNSIKDHNDCCILQKSFTKML